MRIQPISEKLLRNKDFIKTIGETCKKKNISIYLEGAALAHSFYQLVRTGANVINSYDIKEYDEEIEFNKLVRDNIPEKIWNNGENVICSYITGDLLVSEIKRKIIEEAYEVFDAKSNDEILEELADLKEICYALRKRLQKGYSIKKANTRSISDTECLFEYAVPVRYRQSMDLAVKDILFRISFERTKDRFQLDLLFGKNQHINFNELFEIDNARRAILVNAFNISNANDRITINKYLDLMTPLANAIISQKSINCSLEDIEQIRINKLKKRGGFNKGYILKSTSYKRDKLSDFFGKAIENWRPGTNIIETYNLPFRDNIDVDTLADNRLLVRINFQFCSQSRKWEISNKKITNVLPEVERIEIRERILDDKIRFQISFVKQIYYQMSLNDLVHE